MYRSFHHQILERYSSHLLFGEDRNSKCHQCLDLLLYLKYSERLAEPETGSGVLGKIKLARPQPCARPMHYATEVNTYILGDLNIFSGLRRKFTS